MKGTGGRSADVGMVLFTRPEQRAVVSLSGGERRRLYHALCVDASAECRFPRRANQPISILKPCRCWKEFLDNFSGALVVVTHDRYPLDRNVDFIMSF